MILLLADVAARGTVLVLLALVATAFLGRRSAALRHAVLATALLFAGAMPVLQAVVPGWHAPALRQMLERPPAPAEPVALSLSSSEALSAIELATEPPRPRPGSLVVWVWFLGAVLSLGVLAAGLLRLAWLSSRAERVRERGWIDAAEQLAESCGLKRRVVLLRSPHPALLLTWGLVRPEIFLPAGTDDWTDERRRVVLAHELAHIRRSDWVVQVAAEAIRSLYWFNPLVWIACRKLRQESECACDDAVLRGGIAGAEYAAHLLEVARGLRRWQDPWRLATPAMAQSSTLERRVRTMLDAQRIRTPVTRTTAALIVFVVLLAAIPIAGFSGTADPTAAQSAPVVTPVPVAAQAQPAPPATPQSVPVAPVTVQPVPPVSPAVAVPVNAPRAVSPAAVPAPAAAPNAPRAVRPAAIPPPAAPRAVTPAPAADGPGATPAIAVPALPVLAPPAPAQSPGVAAAQTGDGFLAGNINDQTGARVPGVIVTLTNVKAGGAFTTTSDAGGQYEFAGLPDGTYVVRAALPGFVTASADVTVRRNADERRNITMRLGTVQERITVSSTASAVAVADPIERQRPPVEPAALEAVVRKLVVSRELRVEAVERPFVQVAPPVRVGGNIRQPVKIKDVRPDYPASLAANGITGTVVAVGTIGLDGSVQNLEAASAHPELADAILTAVRQWRFRPTQLNGMPFETTMVVTAEFTID